MGPQDNVRGPIDVRSNAKVNVSYMAVLLARENCESNVLYGQLRDSAEPKDKPQDREGEEEGRE